MHDGINYIIKCFNIKEFRLYLLYVGENSHYYINDQFEINDCYFVNWGDLRLLLLLLI